MFARSLPLLLLAAIAFAVPVTAQDAAAQSPDPAALVASVEESTIREHIEAIDEPRDPFEQPEALAAAGDYIEQQLASYGLDVTREDVEFDGETSPNIIGVRRGDVCPERVFIVGSHYDSVNDTPGADDDASGVAGMLAIAEALQDTPLPATVWFTAFTFEEAGIIGSAHLAAQARDDNVPAVGMFSLEMIGYTDAESKFILVLGNQASTRLVDAFDRAHAAYVPELEKVTLLAEGNGETSPDTRRSDHAPFWDAGYQALLVTDTANFRNPNYHEPTDTIDTLDLPFATNVTRAMLATTIEHLTYDADANGQPDVCTAPLIATPTAVPAAPAPTSTPAPLPATTPPTGIAPPNTGDGTASSSPRVRRTMITLGGILALFAFASAAALRMRRDTK